MWNINAPQGRIPCAIFTKFAEFVKFGTEEGTEGAKFHPNRCNVLTLLGKKPSKSASDSKLNTGALRFAMLPARCAGNECKRLP